MGRNACISVLIFCSIHTTCFAFVGNYGCLSSKRKRWSHNCLQRLPTYPAFTSILKLSTQAGLSIDSLENTLSSLDNLHSHIKNLCSKGRPEDAIALLEKSDQLFSEKKVDFSPDESCYITILQALAESEELRAPELADSLFEKMNHKGCVQTSSAYNAIISVWSDSFRKEAGDKCSQYLQSLWSLYDETKEPKFVPLRSSYISTITALSRSRQGREGAAKAEELLENMEELCREHSHLAPTTICVNGVLNAWSKSGLWRGAATRCEEILERMIELYEQGRTEMMPDTTSFNTVVDALSKSREEKTERRAEKLLERMQVLSTKNDSLKLNCSPDQVSFNIVLNCWAQSRARGAAHRATAILEHMEQRYATNDTDVHPDTASYTTVINAWARSREEDACSKAEEVFKWSEDAKKNGNTDVKPNALTYNSLINCYAKSNPPEASERAIELLNIMKAKSTEEGFEDCHPDVVTYTSVIDTLSKRSTLEASKKAESLLEELESAYETTGDKRLKPNIRTYTSVVNCIARSREQPERAEAILNRILASFEAGDKALKPDVVSYNALINAYGWSREGGKGLKCFEILKKMIDLHESGKIFDVKPDIITCNSVLNACAFDTASTDSERAELMDTIVQTLEIFQTAAPKYGYPDHSTYSQVLSGISKHMPMNERRLDMAEATFWQCCHSGNVNAMVISSLRSALPWDKFSSLMGQSLKSKKGQKLIYDLSRLPEDWTRYASRSFKSKSNGRRSSRPSRKRDRGFQITKNTLSKSKK